MPIHKSNNFQTNNVEIAALAAPRPMLLISDGMDWTRNTPKLNIHIFKKVYSLYNAEHKVENVHFPAEKHDYGYSKRAAAYIFLAYHLKLNESAVNFNGTVNENFVKILPMEQLQVFNDKNPRPKNALIGDEAVIKYLNLH